MAELLVHPGLEARLKQKINFLSSITGLPIVKTELVLPAYDSSTGNLPDFTFDLQLGEDYHIHVRQSSCSLTEAKSHDAYRDNWEYEIKDGKGRLVGSSDYVNLSKNMLKNRNNQLEINNARLEGLLTNFGGISVEHPAFMDYESYSTESLGSGGSHNFFKDIYLLLMCDLKENGAKLAPILSKKEEIREAMEKGDVEGVNSLLKLELSIIESGYDQRALAHAIAESEEILQFTYQKSDYHNLEIPLAHKFPDDKTQIIPGNVDKKYNLLVVEDFGSSPSMSTVNRLSKKVAVELARTGKYGGSAIYATVNLDECLNLCGTGQIDAIIMDGGSFALGDALGAISDMGGSMTLNQGGDYREIPSMDGSGEKELWKQMIFDRIKENGHSPPPCAIFPSDVMGQDLGRYIDIVLLKQEHPLKDVYTMLEQKHSEQMGLAIEVERAGKKALGNGHQKYEHPIAEGFKRDWQNFYLDTGMRGAEEASRIGGKLSQDEFSTAFFNLIAQQMPQFLQHSTPTKVTRGLQVLDVALNAYPSYAKKSDLMKETVEEIGIVLSTAATVMADQSFYIRHPAGKSEYVTMLSNAYVLINALANDEHYRQFMDERLISSPDFFGEPISLRELVNNHMLRNIVVTTSGIMGKKSSTATGGTFGNSLVNFLIGYGRRLAKVTGGVQEFDQLYREHIRTPV